MDDAAGNVQRQAPELTQKGKDHLVMFKPQISLSGLMMIHFQCSASLLKRQSLETCGARGKEQESAY